MENAGHMTDISWAGPEFKSSIDRDILLDEINEGIADYLDVHTYHAQSFITDADLTHVRNAMMLTRNHLVAKFSEIIMPGSTADPIREKDDNNG